MFQVRWTNKAIDEQVAVFNFWIQHNHSAAYAQKIYAGLKKAEAKLKKNPFIGVDTNYKGIKRLLIVKRFSLFYKIYGKIVYILSLWDNRRNPDTLPIQ